MRERKQFSLRVWLVVCQQYSSGQLHTQKHEIALIRGPEPGGVNVGCIGLGEELKEGVENELIKIQHMKFSKIY